MSTERVEESGAANARDEELQRDLQKLGGKLIAMAQTLVSAPDTKRTIADASSIGLGFSDRIIAAIALSILRSRQRRRRYFKADIFGEPAWDMLLEAFVCTAKANRVSSTSLCLVAGVSVSTGLRTLQMLEDEGLLRRYRVPDDKRLALVELTPVGFKLMRRYISEGILRDEMPLPESVPPK